MSNRFKRIILFILCFMFTINMGIIYSQAEDNFKDDEKNIILEEVKEFGYYPLQVKPVGTAKKIKKVITDSVIELEKISIKNVEYQQKPSFYIEGDKLYIKKLKNKHTLKLELSSGESYNFIYKDGKFKKINESDIPKKQLHVKLDGYFEGALVGQKKYDAISGATGSASSNSNSNIKVMVAETESGFLPADSDWKELAKSEIEVDKGNTKINLDPESGMKPMYNSMTSAVTLSGIPKNASNYPVTIDLYDIYGRHAKSNEAWFGVSDINKVYLEDVLKDVNIRLISKPGNRVLWYQEPWYISLFNKNKKDGNESITLNKNINLWYGSRESGVYGVLGKPVIVKNKPNKDKGEVYPWEDRKPFQDLILEEGTDLTMAYMKVMSGVNIIVKKGAVLNLHDSSIYGKVTVDGGTLRVNYNKNLDFDGNNVVSGTSIQGQIILNDGAVLENSTIYSNTNNISDEGIALRNIKPVVLVKGDAFIKGKVFVRGDEAPTGTDENTKKYYRGQNAMKIDGGSLTIADNASLYLYGGGTKANTSLGGNALELMNEGKVLGNGTLVAMGGNGSSDVAGYAISGQGDISVNKAYLRAGNSYNKNLQEQKAITDNIKIHKNVVGNIINTAPISTSSDHDYDEYWKLSSSPKDISDRIKNELINPNGEEKIIGKEVPEDLPESDEGPKRVDLISKETNRYSIGVNLKDKNSSEWLDAIKKGEAKLILNNKEELKISNDENKLGYNVHTSTLYIYSLNLNDKVTIKLDGYRNVELKAISDPWNNYRLDRVTNLDDEKPIKPEDETEVNDEVIKNAIKKVNDIVSSLNLDFLEVQGINEDLNKSNIKQFKNKIEELKKITNKTKLTEKEKKDLIEFTQKNENGKYKGFRKFTKNIMVDLRNNGEQTIKNKHDGNKLHVRLKEGKTTFESKLKNVKKIGNPKLKVYYILKDEYNTKVNTISGATPEFEKHLLDSKYYDIEDKGNGEYEIYVNEDELLNNSKDVSLLKFVFSAELADGVYIENKDFVFLSEKKIDNPKPEDPKPDKPTPEQPKPEEPKPDKPTPEQPKPEEPKPDKPTPEQPKPEEPKPDKPTPEQPKPEEPKPDKPTPEQPKPEEPKTDKSKTDEAKLSLNVDDSQYGEKTKRNLKEYSGYNRYITAVEISKNAYNNAENVIIATGQNPIDALSASAFAYSKKAPILLSEKNKIDSKVLDEIKRLKAKKVTIIGGLDSISDNVSNQLKNEGLVVNRISGKDRYSTSINILKESDFSFDKVLIVSGVNYADALSLSGYSAMKQIPMILVSNDMDIDAIKLIEKTKEFIVVGGDSSINDYVINKCKKIGYVKRIFGNDRYQTSYKVLTSLYDNIDSIVISSGDNNRLTDALAGSSISAINKAPMILIDREINESYLNNKKYKNIFVLGGNSSITEKTRNVLIKYIN